MKRLSSALEKWGYYLLAALCAAVILFSALWTKQLRAQSPADAQALMDESQRLSEVTPSPPPLPSCTPAGGFLRGYSAEPVYFPALGLWQCHPGADYALEDGAAVVALRGGIAEMEDGALTVTDAEGNAVRYRGCREWTAAPGGSVQAGDVVGYAGGSVPYEGAGHVCLTFLRQGVPYDPEN